jgi:hypothetical protein
VTLRSGTPAIQGATYRVFNQGETGSQAGDGTPGSYGTASANGAGLAIVDGGTGSDSASLLLGERTGTRSFNFTAQNMVLGDTDGTTASLTQTIVGGTSGNQTQIINLNSVGPILGVNRGADILPYNFEIDLGQIDFGGSGPLTLEQTLTITNLFGTNLGDLTNLTIANTDIDGAGAGAFNILSQDYTNGAVAAAGISLGDLVIQFAPSSVGTFLASLYFETDMNRPFGDTGNATTALRFNLSGRAINSSAAAPIPGSPALLVLGLAILARLRMRRA